MSLPTPFVAAGMTLDNTIGSAFLGVMGASVLFGITTLQAYLYYHHFRRDSRLHRVAVGVLWALDALHLVITLHAVYFYVVTHFGSFTIDVVWSLKFQILLNAIIIVMVQSLYAYRVWLLGGYHRGVLGYLVASVVAGGFVIGVVCSYETFRTTTFADVQDMSWAVYASFAASTTIDFVLSVAMCHYLRKSQGPQSRLNSRISTVMQYTLSSGLFTSACSLSCLFAYALSPNTLVYIGLEFLLTKLYVGSFLAMMNARPRGDNSSPGDSQTSAMGLVPSLSITTPTSRTLMGSSPISSVSTERKYPWDIDVEAPPSAVKFSNHHFAMSPAQEKPAYSHQW